MTPSTENILGVPVSALSQDNCVAKVLGWVREGSSCKFVACANPHSLVVATRDMAFRESLQTADLLVPDGIGVVFASHILGGQIRKRTTGSDVFRRVTQALNQSGGASMFFLGAREETLERIRERMRRDYPAVHVAGCYSPPFREQFCTREREAMIVAINQAKPDILWVGMTAPKQEKWIRQCRDQLDVKVAAAIGAVFDFYAGRVPRPGLYYQFMGLEWLRRWLGEPKRLLRRNLNSPVFLSMVLRQCCHKN